MSDACRHCGEIAGSGDGMLKLLAKLERANKRLANQDALAWLVERESPAEYAYMDDMGIQWTSDPNEAMRFARRKDAEMFAAGSDDAVRICEHMWCSPGTTRGDET